MLKPNTGEQPSRHDTSHANESIDGGTAWLINRFASARVKAPGETKPPLGFPHSLRCLRFITETTARSS